MSSIFFFQDIRMYFSSQQSKKGLNKTTTPSTKTKSKKRHVLSSDDEDDVVPCSPIDNKPKPKLNEKRKLINPIDVFGLEPVKQSAIKVIKPSKKNKVSILCNCYLK